MLGGSRQPVGNLTVCLADGMVGGHQSVGVMGWSGASCVRLWLGGSWGKVSQRTRCKEGTGEGIILVGEG